MNPVKQSRLDRDGITYVLLTMYWYRQLSGLLLDENIKAEQKGLHGELEKQVINLYEKLILFQIQSARCYCRNRFEATLKDAAGIEGWEGKFEAVKSAEKNVVEYADQFNKLDCRDRLRDVAKTAEQQILELGSIGTAIADVGQQNNEPNESAEDNLCRRKLFIVRPQAEKDRIEIDKEQPLNDLYKWIFEHPDYRKWLDDSNCKLLWIHGNPGQGKTMLLCGIIFELKEQSHGVGGPCFFFCQATRSDLRTANAVLLGVISLLTEAQPPLLSHVRAVVDKSSEDVFQGKGGRATLSRILVAV